MGNRVIRQNQMHKKSKAEINEHWGEVVGDLYGYTLSRRALFNLLFVKLIKKVLWKLTLLETYES